MPDVGHSAQKKRPFFIERPVSLGRKRPRRATARAECMLHRNIYSAAHKTVNPRQIDIGLSSTPLRRHFNRPSLQRWLDTAFPLAGDACFLEIQLPFHPTAGLVGYSPFLQETEDVFPLGLNELGTKAGTKGSHFRPDSFA